MIDQFNKGACNRYRRVKQQPLVAPTLVAIAPILPISPILPIIHQAGNGRATRYSREEVCYKGYNIQLRDLRWTFIPCSKTIMGNSTRLSAHLLTPGAGVSGCGHITEQQKHNLIGLADRYSTKRAGPPASNTLHRYSRARQTSIKMLLNTSMSTVYPFNATRCAHIGLG